MERLTKKISKTVQDKYSLGSYLQYDFANTDDTNKLLNKLGAFEDFMEEQGFESVEQLKEIIEIFKTSRRLCFGISTRRNGKSLMLMNELIDLCKYKNNWQKLKEWAGYLCYFELVDKMEELEKEGN